MSLKTSLREKVWKELLKVAKPDSRFHFDFSSFIPDFEGSEKCIEKIRKMDIYKNAKNIMITPDNNLIKLREYCIIDNKCYVMPTYGIKRGFLKISRENVPKGKEDFAATLDGAEIFGKPVTLRNIQKIGKIDFMVTGASIVNMEGVRYGKGHGYFDLEWAMFRDIGVVSEETPIITVVHDCQLVDEDFPIDPFDTIIDIIVTPTRIINVKKKHPKPIGIIWDKLPKEMIESIPPLKELQEIKKLKI